MVHGLESWCGEVDSHWIHLCIGGRQGATDMPVLWEYVVGCVLGPIMDPFRRQGRGVVIPATAVGVDPECHPRILSRHAAERIGQLDHFTWADDIVLSSTKRRNYRAWETSWTPLYSARA